MLHDERYFSNPDSFIPERWIESERGDETCVKEAWIPFSYGKWNCIGKPYFSWRGRLWLIIRLALMEMRVTMAKLVWTYDISLNKEGQEIPSLDHRSVSAGKLEVRMTKVERNWAIERIYFILEWIFIFILCRRINNAGQQALRFFQLCALCRCRIYKQRSANSRNEHFGAPHHRNSRPNYPRQQQMDETTRNLLISPLVPENIGTHCIPRYWLISPE